MTHVGRRLLALCALGIAAGTAGAENAEEEMADPYLWLEEVEGERALRWVKARNRATTRALASASSFKRLRRRLLAVFDSDDRIPDIDKLGDRYYNFWRDKAHPRGL